VIGRTLLVVVLLLPLVLGAFGCGKKGPPVPPAERTQAVVGFLVDTFAVTVVHLTRAKHGYRGTKKAEMPAFTPEAHG
jgi:predicted small lipoprotein YifL